MTGSELKIPTFDLQRYMQWLCGVMLVGAAISFAAIKWGGWSSQWVASLTAVGASFIAAMISLTLVYRASRVSLSRVFVSILGGSAVRLLICAGVAALMVAGLGYAKQPVVFWMLGWYLLILLMEVLMFRHYLRSFGGGASGLSDGHDGTGKVGEVGTCSPAGS